MYIAPGQGQTTQRDKVLMLTETTCHFSHTCKFEKKSLWSLILYTFFMILYIYIALWQWHITNWGGHCDINRKALWFVHLMQFKNKNLWSLILYNFFPDLTHVYSPGTGADSPPGGEAKLQYQQKCIVISFICWKFKKISSKSDFIHFLMI